MAIFRNSTLFLCALLSGVLFSLENNLDIKPSLKNQKIQKEIIEKVKKEHFFKVNKLSEVNEVFKLRLIESLDPTKVYFTKPEVEKFSSNTYQEIFDLKNSFQILNNYFNRLIEATNYQIELLENVEFDYQSLEFIDIFAEDNDWKDLFSELRREWFLMTKNDLLIEILDADLSNIDEIKQDLIKDMKEG